MIIIELKNVYRSYKSGLEKVDALSNINLAIHAGEMVSIIGSSGSGKSTLMNILGCIDRPSSGIYTVAGNNISDLNDNEVSRLRRDYFGFIFQSYHLVSHLTAIENIELPAFYSGVEEEVRREKARKLLKQFGLDKREDHFPSQLSGGQQQRVSISRALINGGYIILADEPTGALDSHSGREVLTMLRSLQQVGHTIIIITHDAKVADNTDRVIQLQDGHIILDSRRSSLYLKDHSHASSPQLDIGGIKKKEYIALGKHLENAFKTAIYSLKSNALRSLLTILGIIIGITSVISIVALGQGMRDSVLKNFDDMANLSLTIFPGKEEGDAKEDLSKSLLLSDIELLNHHPSFEYVRPQVDSNERIRYDRNDISGQVSGVGIDGFKKDGGKLIDGRGFRAEDISRNEQVVLLGEMAKKHLFPRNSGNVIGSFVLIGKLPCRVIGIVREGSSVMTSADSFNVWLPYTTASIRLLGKRYINSIAVRTIKKVSPSEGEDIISKMLEKAHGRKDFHIYNNRQAFASINNTTYGLTLGLGCIAAISLLVGGIGVMNIMLVSVSERVREIGIRRAIGARKQDILTQFLVESIFLCIVGGIIGISCGIFICQIVNIFQQTIHASISLYSILIALVTCVMIGIFFGVIPAKKAANLDPALALARE